MNKVIYSVIIALGLLTVGVSLLPSAMAGVIGEPTENIGEPIPIGYDLYFQNQATNPNTIHPISMFTETAALSGILVDANGIEVEWNTLDKDVQEALEDRKIYYLHEGFDDVDKLLDDLGSSNNDDERDY